MLTARHLDDPARVVTESRRIFETVFYGGEAFPQVWLNWGPAGHAGYFGCPYAVGDETVWYEPILEDWDDGFPAYSAEHGLLRRQLDAAAWIAREGAGDFLVSTPDNSGSLDALARIRGTERLLLDLVDRPDDVARGLASVVAAWADADRRFFEATRPANDGGSTIGWLSVWAPGRFSQLQSDISVMLSNGLFKRFVVDELTSSLAVMDHSLYHLDGDEQVRHLDDLLALGRLDMIQWVTVAGRPSYLACLPVFRRIQAAGKGLLINDVKIGDVERLLESLRPEGLLIMTEAETEDQARALLRRVARKRGGPG
jgi:hypothetical protein